MSPEESAFADLVESRLTEAERLTGYRFPDLRSLIKGKGAAEAARMLLSPSSVGSFTPGFRVLASHGLLSHSIEQAVIDSVSSGLFTDLHISNARDRLAMAKMIGLGGAMKRVEEIVVAWVPNRPSFHKHPSCGNVIVCFPTSDTGLYTHTVGACDSDWVHLGVAGRRSQMQRIVTKMLHEDMIRLEVIQAALCQVDEWQRFPFSVARPPAKDD
jgi:hypothetical protein